MSRKSFTKEEFIEKSKQVHGNKYDYSKVKYLGKRNEVCIICPEHGEFWQNAGDHMRVIGGHGCKKCADDRKRSCKEKFIEKSKKVHGDKYDYHKVDYFQSRTKVCIICPEHGEFWQEPGKHIYSARGCSICGGSNRLTKEEFIHKAKKVHGEKYDYSKVEYTNHGTKLCIICLKHGGFWQVANSHLNGNGCPVCKSSKGEIKIRDWLFENNILFFRQKRFKNCRDKRTLPFDFYLPDYNVCIEYDGMQHYKPMGFGSKCNEQKNFEKTNSHDSIRNKFCEENNIKLLRIAYYENVTKKLEEFLL